MNTITADVTVTVTVTDEEAFYLCDRCPAYCGEDQDPGTLGWHGAGSPYCECNTYCPDCTASGEVDLCTYGE